MKASVVVRPGKAAGREGRVGVVLMTYGSPAKLDDIPAYLKKVRGGRDPDDALVTEFRRRYTLIGGSPLLRITIEQAAALEAELNQEDGGRTYRATAGMRFFPPLIAEAVSEAATGAAEVVGVIMSPQYSPIIMGGYLQEIQRGVTDLRRADLKLSVAGDWHLQPYFLRALAEKITQALDRFPREARDRVPVLMTAHSMPKRVVEKEQDYIDHLKDTAAAVARLAGLPVERWSFCYQSAGHTPEEWLKPDFADVMPDLYAAGHRNVLVAPVQFLADHLEILYDLDIAARAQAEAAGLEFSRIRSLNASPLLIKALASVVRETLAGGPRKA